MMDSHNRAAANDYNASSEPLNLLYLGLQRGLMPESAESYAKAV